MTTATASKLDIDKFAKVYRLIAEGATKGERTAAHARAEAMAGRAGMTLKQAASKLDSRTKAKPAASPSSDWRDVFRDMDDWMEAKHPGYKAKQAAKNAAREERQAKRRRELLKLFGSVSAVFDMTEIERALYDAATPFAERSAGTNWCGTKPMSFTSRIGGAAEFRFLDEAEPAAVAAIRDAWPMPATLPALLAEALMWAGLRDDRSVFVESEYRHHAEAEARIEILEHELHNRPAETWDDVEARFGWERHKFERQWLDPTEEKPDGLMMTLRRDFEMLRRRYEAPVQDGHDVHHRDGYADTARQGGARSRRTNADKRRDVLSILDIEPGLADREIARRCGVSPQTVGNIRRSQRTAI